MNVRLARLKAIVEDARDINSEMLISYVIRLDVKVFSLIETGSCSQQDRRGRYLLYGQLRQLHQANSAKA